MANVYRQMLLQICVDYPGLPDVTVMKMSGIRFFYEGSREELKKVTKK